jgi:hypothetical protein
MKKRSARTVVAATQEPASGANTEAAELREPSAGPEQPAKDQN